MIVLTKDNTLYIHLQNDNYIKVPNIIKDKDRLQKLPEFDNQIVVEVFA